MQANKVKAAEIGSMALNKEITRKEAEKQLRELPDPMEGYREFLKKNSTAAATPAAAAPAPDAAREAAIEELRKRGKWPK